MLLLQVRTMCGEAEHGEAGTLAEQSDERLLLDQKPNLVLARPSPLAPTSRAVRSSNFFFNRVCVSPFREQRTSGSNSHTL